MTDMFSYWPKHGKLVLYSTVYYRFVYYRGRVYGHDGGHEEGNLTSRVTWWFRGWTGSVEDQL